MKIALVSPCDEQNEWKNSRSVFVFPPLALACLKAVTPVDHNVQVIDETIQEVRINEDTDLVGISIVTANANRGYDLADQLRQKGITVVMGGIHVTLCPDEARQHADAIVVGEGEEVWPQLLEDVENKKLESCYQAPAVDLAEIPIPDHAVFSNERYRIPNTVMATRGCPFGCSFCSTSLIYGHKYRKRSIADVITEIQQFQNRFFIFLDDNLFFDPQYARELMTAVTPLKKRWVSQAAFNVAHDQELLRLIKKAGCMAFLIGFESVADSNFHELGKPVKSLENYSEAIEKIHAAGILVQGSFIFGFDGDTPDIFGQTIDFVKKIGIDTANFCTLTPTPGTPLFDRFDAENRLLTKDWSQYTRQKVVFKPKKITPHQLAVGRLWAYHKFYSLPSMIKRMPLLFPQFFWFWLYNISFRVGTNRSSKTEQFLARNTVTPE
ncbi:B12-binding domain-containing radical SAM protein [candidate division CSSED10-310 bacterium]|uniref:B12-binding domain-containing radical SAM protein n=1 Tax=candidate division CSSED10-310 bacterium TaxID=2855610 RepID=A0ABV6Z6V7_UNCC1